MILRSFYNLGSGASVLDIDSETLIGLGALRPMVVVGAHVVRSSTLPLVVTVMVFRARRCPISGSKPAESR